MRSVARLLEAFAAEPRNDTTFVAIEQALSQEGDPIHLAGVYEQRLSVLPPHHPERVPLLLRLGRLMEDRMEDLRGARRRYQEAAREAPTEAEPLRRLRQLHVRMGDLAAAVQVAELELRLERPLPDRAWLLAEVASLWRKLGDLVESKRCLDRALDLDPACGAALEVYAELEEEAGRPEMAISLLERWAGTLADHDRAAVCERMAGMLAEEDPERALALLRDAARLDPSRVSALDRLLPIEEERGNFSRIDEICESLWAIRTAPADRMQLALRAAEGHLEAGGRAESALRWAERAGEHFPNDPAVHLLRARALEKLGRTAERIGALERLFELSPGRPGLALEIATLREQQGDATTAAGWLRRHLEQCPDDSVTLAALDRCVAAAGRPSERIEILERRAALASTPGERARLLSRLGKLWAGPLGKPRRAEEAFRRALAEDIESTDAIEGLEKLLRDERPLDLAAILEELARGSAPAGARARWWSQLGRVRRELLDDADGAVEAFRQALSLVPGDARALLGLREVARLTQRPELTLEACERELAHLPEGPGQIRILEEAVESARAAGDPVRAYRFAAAWAEQEPGPEALRAMAEAAQEAGERGEEHRALVTLESLLENRSEERRACLVRLGELELQSPTSEGVRLATIWLEEALLTRPDPELRRRLADLYERMERWPEVVRLLQESLSEMPSEEAPRLRLELARALERMGDRGAAAETLEKAWELSPDNARLAEALESMLAELGRFAELARLLRERAAREDDPELAERLALRAGRVLLEDLGQPAEAVAVLRDRARADRCGPLEQLYGRALERACDGKALERWLEDRGRAVDGVDRVDSLLRLAQLRRDADRAEEAITTLWQAHAVAPMGRRSEIRQSLRVWLDEELDADGRDRMLAHLIAEEPDSATRGLLRFDRALLLLEGLGRSDEACAELERARSEGALDMTGLRLLAQLYESLQRWPERAEALSDLISQTRDPARLRILRLELAELLGSGPEPVRDPIAAETALREILEADPEDAETFHRLTRLLSKTGRHAALAKLLGERLASPDLEPEQWRSLALRLAELEPAEQAASTLGSLRERLGPDPALDRALANALRESGQRLAEARLAGECALMVDERSSARREWLGRFVQAVHVSEAPPAERLAAVSALARRLPGQPLLSRLRLDLLREAGDAVPLARALEEVLSRPDVLSGVARQRAVRELLVLVMDVLGDAPLAVRWLEQELPADPTLAPLASRLAARLEDVRLRARLLAGIVLDPPEGFEPSVTQIKDLALALAGGGRLAEADPLLRAAIERAPWDVDLVRACDSLARTKGDAEERLRWLERRFALESGEVRRELVQAGLELAESTGNGASVLLWLRRWEALDPLPRPLVKRWLELEHSSGNPASELGALRSVRSATKDPRMRARLALREATLLEKLGEGDVARRCLREAVEECEGQETELLRAWDRLLRDSPHTAERAMVLQRLAGDRTLTEPERARCAAIRARLLARHPDQLELAADELRRLFDHPAGVDAAQRVNVGRELLGLYRSAGRAREWCAVAEKLIPVLPREEGTHLRAALARELTRALGARERAIVAWRQVLGEEPENEEGLRTLAVLLDVPGREALRAEVLDRLARLRVPDRLELRLEAARLLWTRLGDGRSALEHLEAVLEMDPERSEAHELRVEVCAHLGRAADAATSLCALLEHGAYESTAERWVGLAAHVASLPELREGTQRAAARAMEASSSGERIRAEIRAILEQIGDWDGVVRLLGEEIAAASAELAPSLLRRLARVQWLERRDAQAACGAFESLGQIDELTLDDRERLDEVLVALGRWQEALEIRRGVLESREAGAREWLDLASDQLNHLEDPTAAASSCDEALRRDPESVQAIRLRADLDARLGDAASEASRRELIAERLSDLGDVARQLARAGSLAREPLSDRSRARRLFERALEADPSCIPALVGTGELAFERGDWQRALPPLHRALSLLPGSPFEERAAELAALGAQVAAELGLGADTLALIDRALEAAPGDPATLDMTAAAAARIEAWQKAAELLRTRLDQGDLDGGERAERLLRLARAAETLGDRTAAADALEEAAALRSDDEVLRARLVEVLEGLGDRPRLLAQLDAWGAVSPEGARGEILLRAARVARGLEDREGARRRLEQVVREEPAHGDAWADLVSLTLEIEGPEAALDRSSSALEVLADTACRARVLGLRARIHDALGRPREAAEDALAALEGNPEDVAAAQCLALHAGRTGEWLRAARALEHALDLGRFAPPVEAQIWAAIGRLYAGPLSDLERAERAYRRALDCNPDHDRAREALADVTSFDPARHAESLQLHLALLEKFPARRGSWAALDRMADHWKRSDARGVCRWVLASLDGRGETESIVEEARTVLVMLHPGPAAEAALRGAATAEGSPAEVMEGAEPPPLGVLPSPLVAALDRFCGTLWQLPDDVIRSYAEAAMGDRKSSERRGRRRGRSNPPVPVGPVEPEEIRADLLAVESAHTVGVGSMGLRDALEALVSAWPSTADLNLEGSADLAEISQMCPPARTLLLKLSRAVASRLGLGAEA